jgi:hypothetical protein
MYYLSDRLNAVRTQSVAGRNKIEYYLSDRLNAVRTQSVAGRNKIESTFIVPKSNKLAATLHDVSISTGSYQGAKKFSRILLL